MQSKHYQQNNIKEDKGQEAKNTTQASKLTNLKMWENNKLTNKRKRSQNKTKPTAASNNKNSKTNIHTNKNMKTYKK